MMKKYILAIALVLLSATFCVAEEGNAVTDGPGGWVRNGRYIRVANPATDVVVLDNITGLTATLGGVSANTFEAYTTIARVTDDDFKNYTSTAGDDAATLNGQPGSYYTNFTTHEGNIKTAKVGNWDDIVCEVTECNGVHTHDFGEEACQITFKTISTVQMLSGCTVHLDGGKEYKFEAGAFPNIKPNFVNSSVWIGIDSTGIVQQSSEFTNSQRLSTAPLVRVQSIGGPSHWIATIMDTRFKSSKFEWRFHNWVRDYVGALAGSGLETSEVGTRNLALTGGTFSDTEIDGHILSAFSAFSGVTIHSTAFSPVTTIRGLLQADNIQYDTGSGLADMTNNNWYASHNLAMSTAGGVVNGIDTGRGPTFILIYSNGQWNSLGEAREQPFNLGPFAGSKDIIRLAKLVVQKNSGPITDIVQVQPFNTSGSGTGVAGTSSLQEVYNNSPNGTTPEITTSPTNNGLTVRYGGDDGNIVEYQKGDGTPVFLVTTSFKQKVGSISLRYEQPSGTQGGDTVSQAWNTIPINTEVRDTGSFANISSNGYVILQPFTYYNCVMSGPTRQAEAHKVRFRDITNGITPDEGVGTSEYGSSTVNVQTRSMIYNATFVVESVTVFSLQQYIEQARAVVGLGTMTVSGEVEVYGTIDCEVRRN